MSAKDAVLQRTGSHSVSDDNFSSRHEGISKEEVFLYFTAKWRGQPVIVTMSADKYAHSSGMSEWRVYASDARFYNEERNGGRGAETTGTARSALSKLCQPLAMEWLASDDYQASFEAALGRMIMRKFRDDYSASRRVHEALATFEDRLPSSTWRAIRDALVAYNDFKAAETRASELIG